MCVLCRLSSGQSIQMLTALVLQLVQCLVSPRDNSDGSELKVLLSHNTCILVNCTLICASLYLFHWCMLQGDELDLQLTKGYDLALSIANKFLTKFQKK